MPIILQYSTNETILKGSNIKIVDTNNSENVYILLNVLSDYPINTIVTDIQSEDKRIYVGELSTFNWNSFEYTDAIQFVTENINKNYLWSDNGKFYEFTGDSFTNELNSSSWKLIYKAPEIEKNHYKVTKNEFNYLVTSSKLIPGALYEVSGVDPILWDDGVEQGITVYLKAISKNTYDRGIGKFYIPNNIEKFKPYYVCLLDNMSDTNNIYTQTIVTANNGAIGTMILGMPSGWGQSYLLPTSGDWLNATSITGVVNGVTVTSDISIPFDLNDLNIGSKFVFNGMVFQSVTGKRVPINPSSLIDWQLIPFNLVDYKVRYDIIDYNLKFDCLTYRYDPIRGNEVENPLGSYPSPYSGPSAKSARILFFDWINNHNVKCKGNGIIDNWNNLGNFSDLEFNNTSFYNNLTLHTSNISGVKCNSPYVDLLQIKDNLIYKLKNCDINHNSKIINSTLSLSGAFLNNSKLENLKTVISPNYSNSQSYVDTSILGNLIMNNSVIKNYFAVSPNNTQTRISECSFNNGVYDFNNVNYSSIVLRNLNFDIAGRTDKILPNLSSLHNTAASFNKEIKISSNNNFIKIQYTDTGINISNI